MSRRRNRLLLVLVVIMGVITIDQISKQIVIDNLTWGETTDPIPALSDYFQITHSRNTGAAFGFFQQAGDIFLVIAVVVVIAMLYFYPRIPDEADLTRFATGLVCGGALGNAIDRIRHEYVIDFIHYQLPNVISNVSNLADHAIVLGVFLIIYDSWRQEQREKRKKQQAEPAEE